ncbi:uncharacterized protein CcaverHIS019_0308250 [Cutaneotrichosporon cavernicola]|uniref:Helicase SWR1 n=1 Tax=Cutaneotrichosporon cavernicola TaxID=279322 RepID=A0AA48L249_9TREE|nr:uncharacterized protein CcaverHIS019_0308250 [Cutaneotrichosporon cavernicola]BEI90755.1 hypothetical protein CcaverHIS019_0308250 [Cutaneotrichosporon cavernicola]BEI98535.1 hypothetical protein CcaverHIS631_0308340 [Cutaneotrichosporon cavernicola]BEJ06306.1 hypothetical protein CcaverHIS641_0308280 [Cutaneotrichosporon cavernicola]
MPPRRSSTTSTSVVDAAADPPPVVDAVATNAEAGPSTATTPIRARRAPRESAPNRKKRHITDHEMERIRFKLGPNGAKTRRDELVLEREAELRVVLDAHDMAVKEMFHLERYVSILEGWDPEEARVDNSPVFLDYKNTQYNLLDLVAANSIGSLAVPSRASLGPSRTTRRQLHFKSEALGIANGDKGKTKEETPKGKGRTVEVEETPSKLNTLRRGKAAESEPGLEPHQPAPKRGRRSAAAEMPPPPVPKGKKTRRATIAEPEMLEEPEEEEPRGKKRPRGRQSLPVPSKKARAFEEASASPGSSPAPTAPARSPSPTPVPALPSLAHLSFPPPPRRPTWKRSGPSRIVYTDPGQHPPPATFGGDIATYLNSYVQVDDGAITDTAVLEASAQREGYLRNRVNWLQHQGRLLRLLDGDDEPQKKERDRSHRRQAPTGPPPRQTDFQDSLVAHMVQVRGAMMAEAKAKPMYCRRIARMVAAHWEHLANKDERERVAAERELKRKGREVVKTLRKRWALATKIVRAKVLAQQRLEQDRLGKEHLQNMLQRSTGLLEAQREDIVSGRQGDANDGADSDATDDVSAAEESGDEEEVGPEEGEKEEVGPDDDGEREGPEGEEDADVPVLKTAIGEEVAVTSGPADEGDVAGTVQDGSEEEGGEEDEEESDEGEDAVDLRTLVGMEINDAEEDSEGDDEDDGEGEGAADEPKPAADLLETPNGAASPADDSVAGEVVGEPAAGAHVAVRRSQPVTANSPPPVTSTIAESSAASQPPSPPTPRPHSRRLAKKRRLEVADAPDPDANDVEFADSADVDDEDAQLDEAMDDAEAADDDSEDAGLLADADLPIEELLKRYGYDVKAEAVVPTPAEREEVAEDAAELESKPTSADAEPKPASPNDQSLTDAALEVAKRDSSPALVVDGKRQRKVRTVWTPPDDAPQQLASKGKKGKLQIVEPESSSDIEIESTPELSSEEETDEEEEAVEEVADVEEDPNAPRLKPPFLLRGTLRPYQQAGLEWLASLYANNMNGILADEMGLGKTIQTIALLGHLACDLGVWGPHLIIVPTSVILNWEMEFKRFLPGMKVLTYYGNQKERKEKRVGWNTENAWQVCITSYQIVLADQHIFRRKNWVYMILDEAHNIKNFRSQRWQTLLGFKTQRRLLLTGTPLQNNLMELWSLLYFLMPNGITADATAVVGFANHKDFMEWFSNPMDKAVESGETMDEDMIDTVNKLHTLLRPFILRRLKSEVETQLPGKFEHVVYCRLSKRQRFLYDEFMSRAETRETLTSGGYLGVVNVLMQLRKVCNHPDLFEVRPVRTSFAVDKGVAGAFEPTDLLVRKRLLDSADDLDLASMNLIVTGREGESGWVAGHRAGLDASNQLPYAGEDKERTRKPKMDARTPAGWLKYREAVELEKLKARWRAIRDVNRRRCQSGPIYGTTTIEMLSDLPRLLLPDTVVHRPADLYGVHLPPAAGLVRSHIERLANVSPVIDRFAVIPPNAVARDVAAYALPGVDPAHPSLIDPAFDSLHGPSVKLQIAFPDASLLQYDCGKLQKLYEMLRDLKAGGHRVLIFTQMTRVLDILEIFLSYNGHRYLRLDGSTKIEDRQIITERFNSDSRIFCFIASSRSGGVGINLTGADTVFFYDSDWNPSMDRQCMDRAHRIGQTREVHIYRFVSSHTVEENMLKKANQKRLLDRVVIQEGDFTTEFFGRMDWRDMLDDDVRETREKEGVEDVELEPEPETEDVAQHAAHAGEGREFAAALAEVEDEEDAAAARVALGEGEMDFAEFDEDKKAQAQAKRRDESEPAPSGGVSRASASAIPSHIASSVGTPISALEEEEEEDGYDDDDVGGVDEYMLRFVEWDWDYFSSL